MYTFCLRIHESLRFIYPLCNQFYMLAWLTNKFVFPFQTAAGNMNEPVLPIFFFIHGGSYYMNAGRLYPGHILASTQQMIVVTFNYRLGPLGMCFVLIFQHLTLFWFCKSLATDLYLKDYRKKCYKSMHIYTQYNTRSMHDFFFYFSPFPMISTGSPYVTLRHILYTLNSHTQNSGNSCTKVWFLLVSDRIESCYI